MTRSRCARHSGGTLIEALVGLLLTSILFVGLSFVLSRTLVSQRFLNAQSIAVLEMREMFAVNVADATCGNSHALGIGNQSIAVEPVDCPSSPELTVTVSGVESVVPGGEIPAFGATLSTGSDAASQGLFGGDGVITFSY